MKAGLEPLRKLRRRLTPLTPGSGQIAGSGASPAGKTAAVLIPLFERNAELHVLYTRRSDDLLSHQGQVAFPGGKVDPGDLNLLATALREAHEEVGIRPGRVNVLGQLEKVRAAASGYTVTPFVGIIPDPVKLRMNPREVAEIFSVPLESLRDPRFRGRYRWRSSNSDFPAILYEKQVIWGLTFRITLNLLELLGSTLAKP